MITHDMNSTLIGPYVEEEVCEALKDMGPPKPSRNEGFLTLFYYKFWHIIGRDVSDFCLHVLNKGMDFDTVNVTVKDKF